MSAKTDKTGPQRLDKLLADTGKYSRKEASAAIRKGRVQVNGETVADPAQRFSPEGLDLIADGERLSTAAWVCLMLHKPAGYLSATEDRKQGTVLDLIPDELRKRGLSPVGRLDKDTEGLLLLTDNGELTHRLLSPKYHVDKVYLAETDGAVDESDIAAFREGIVLEDGLHCLPAELAPAPEYGANFCLVTVREGKFHQVKRMLASRGKPVLYLKRLSMGELVLDPALEKGAWRHLTEEETDILLTAAGMK